MDIETFREYCLSFEGTHDDFPFGKATSAYDRDILVFYAGRKWFCFVNAVEFDFCNLKCSPDRIASLQARYEGIGPGWHMNKKNWISVRFDSDVPESVIRSLVKDSYELVAAEGRTKTGRRAAKFPGGEPARDAARTNAAQADVAADGAGGPSAR